MPATAVDEFDRAGPKPNRVQSCPAASAGAAVAARRAQQAIASAAFLIDATIAAQRGLSKVRGSAED
jgi:hypothetical protein